MGNYTRTTCADCKGPLSRPGARRCRECYLAWREAYEEKKAAGKDKPRELTDSEVRAERVALALAAQGGVLYPPCGPEGMQAMREAILAAHAIRKADEARKREKHAAHLARLEAAA